MERYSCNLCSATYSSNKTLYRHMRCKHPVGDVELFTCVLCGYSTPRVDSLKQHEITVHQPDRESKVHCALCEFSSPTRKEILYHYSLTHKQTISEETHEFCSKSKFYEWKQELEKETMSEFVSVRGKWIKSQDKTTKLYFHCHRDGVYKSRGNNVRSTKILGSNKIGGHCPARMDVTVHPSGDVTVIFCNTHVGHQSEICRLRGVRMPQNGKIAEGVPFEKILHDVKSSIHSREPERLQLITRRDLHNIKRGKIAKGVAFEKILDDIKSSIHSGEPERLHLITRHDLHNIKRDFGIVGTKEQDINEESEQNERLDANASVKTLGNKLQVLKNRIRSGVMSRETMCKVEKEVDRLLSLTESEFRKEVPHSPNNENLKVFQVPDKSNVQREVLHCPNEEKFKMLPRPIKPKIHPRSIISVPVLAVKSNVVTVKEQPGSDNQSVHVGFDHTYCQS